MHLAVDNTRRSKRPDYDWYLLAAAGYLVLGGIEIAGTILSGSRTIFSDAVHVFIDVLVMMQCAYVDWQVARKEDFFRAKRLDAIGAFVNGVLLMVGSVVVMWDSIPKLREELIPHEVDVHRALWVIVIALLIHLAILFGVLRQVPDHHHGAMKRSARWHVWEDVVIALVALLSVAWIELTRSTRVDLWLSATVACGFIVRGGLFVWTARNTLIDLRLQELAAPSDRDGP